MLLITTNQERRAPNDCSKMFSLWILHRLNIPPYKLYSFRLAQFLLPVSKVLEMYLPSSGHDGVTQPHLLFIASTCYLTPNMSIPLLSLFWQSERHENNCRVDRQKWIPVTIIWLKFSFPGQRAKFILAENLQRYFFLPNNLWATPVPNSASIVNGKKEEACKKRTWQISVQLLSVWKLAPSREMFWLREATSTRRTVPHHPRSPGWSKKSVNSRGNKLKKKGFSGLAETPAFIYCPILEAAKDQWTALEVTQPLGPPALPLLIFTKSY